MIFLPILGVLIGKEMDKRRKITIEQGVKIVQEKSDLKLVAAEEKLAEKLYQFVSCHYSEDVAKQQFPKKFVESDPPANKRIEQPQSTQLNFCPKCDAKLPPPFKSSGRVVCRECSWTNEPKASN